MARDGMDILELLLKRGMDGDVDFLREALVGLLVEGIMEAEVLVKSGAGYGERSADRESQRNGYRGVSRMTAHRWLKRKLTEAVELGAVTAVSRPLSFTST